MLRLSSNLTLALKIFIPIFWTTLLTACSLAAWFGPERYFEWVNLSSLRWGLLLTLLMAVLLFRFVFWPLKRVESDDVHIYVSDYFKTARYRWDSDVVALHQERFLLLFPVAFLELKGKGSFGRKPYFLLRRKALKQLQTAFPDLIPK